MEDLGSQMQTQVERNSRMPNFRKMVSTNATTLICNIIQTYNNEHLPTVLQALIKD